MCKAYLYIAAASTPHYWNCKVAKLCHRLSRRIQ
jgi:hypothetical protein